MNGKQSQYSIGLDKTPANFVPLTPLSFLKRTAVIYPSHLSAVYEGRAFTWSQTYSRCRRFASFLAGRNIADGDTVKVDIVRNGRHMSVPVRLTEVPDSRRGVRR